MKKKYQGSSRVKRAQLQALKKDFETLQMKDSESVTNYCARTMGIANKMRFHGEQMKDVAIVEKILRSLAPKYDYVVCSIEESKDIDTFSLDELQSSLLVHEQKMNRSSSSDEQALKAFTFAESSNTRGRGRGRGRGMGGRGNRDGDRQYQNFNNDQSNFQGRGRGRDHQFDTHGRGRGRDHQFDKSKVECFRCHKFGHYSSECYVKLPQDKEKWEKSNFVEKTELETLLMTYHVKKEPEPDVWYVDIGYSNHMCGSKSSFSSLIEGFHTTVSFGDCSTVNVMGKGDIQIKTKNGLQKQSPMFFYVPDLKSNLLSAGQLQEKGYIITIQNGACEIYDPSRGSIAVVQMSSNRLFPLQIKNVQTCLMTKVKDSSWLWHFRYGHLNFGGLRTLQQRNMVTGLPQIATPTQVCEECVVSKQHRNQFPQGKSWRAKKLLELVHSDICGPINPSSNEDEKRKKLNDKGQKYVFLGVSEASKAYKLFNPLTKKIVTSRDVIFYEENTWEWTKNGSRLHEIPDFFDEVEERIEPQLQSSNADHRTDHQLQSSNENPTANDLIDDQPR
ncbi:hypothetical protein EZV62_004061 [Acer yangbiense]|uniref:CCHC-type domain-containing protein n=1 Tax=Acer yangbiense TaxID=1000413 RepID=A0A5C7IKY1_9ROSI|nr:hypothetical protein EZV62_004061 [Acer yangbiense]